MKSWKLFKTIFMHKINVFMSSVALEFIAHPHPKKRQHFRKHFSLHSNVMQYYIIIYSMHFRPFSLALLSSVLLCNNIHTWTSHGELMPFILAAVLASIFIRFSFILTRLFFTLLFIKWKLCVLLQFSVYVTLITF